MNDSNELEKLTKQGDHESIERSDKMQNVPLKMPLQYSMLNTLSPMQTIQGHISGAGMDSSIQKLHQVELDRQRKPLIESMAIREDTLNLKEDDSNQSYNENWSTTTVDHALNDKTLKTPTPIINNNSKISPMNITSNYCDEGTSMLKHQQELSRQQLLRRKGQQQARSKQQLLEKLQQQKVKNKQTNSSKNDSIKNTMNDNDGRSINQNNPGFMIPSLPDVNENIINAMTMMESSNKSAQFNNVYQLKNMTKINVPTILNKSNYRTKKAQDRSNQFSPNAPKPRKPNESYRFQNIPDFMKGDNDRKQALDLWRKRAALNQRQSRNIKNPDSSLSRAIFSIQSSDGSGCIKGRKGDDNNCSQKMVVKEKNLTSKAGVVLDPSSQKASVLSVSKAQPSVTRKSSSPSENNKSVVVEPNPKQQIGSLEYSLLSDETLDDLHNQSLSTPSIIPGSSNNHPFINIPSLPQLDASLVKGTKHGKNHLSTHVKHAQNKKKLSNAIKIKENSEIHGHSETKTLPIENAIIIVDKQEINSPHPPGIIYHSKKNTGDQHEKCGTESLLLPSTDGIVAKENNAMEQLPDNEAKYANIILSFMSSKVTELQPSNKVNLHIKETEANREMVILPDKTKTTYGEVDIASLIARFSNSRPSKSVSTLSNESTFYQKNPKRQKLYDFAKATKRLRNILSFDLPNLPTEPIRSDESIEDSICIARYQQRQIDFNNGDNEKHAFEANDPSFIQPVPQSPALTPTKVYFPVQLCDHPLARTMVSTKTLFPKFENKDPMSLTINYNSSLVRIDSWWPSNEMIKRERRMRGYLKEDDESNSRASFSCGADKDSYDLGDSSVNHNSPNCTFGLNQERRENPFEPGVLEKIPFCKIHYLRSKHNCNSGHENNGVTARDNTNAKGMYCWQVTELYPNDVMVCCSECFTWRHEFCGGHYNCIRRNNSFRNSQSKNVTNIYLQNDDYHHTRRVSHNSNFTPLCDLCFAEKKIFSANEQQKQQTLLKYQRIEHLRRTLATNQVIRHAAYSKHGGAYKWPLGSVSATHISGHTRSVNVRHDKSEKQWGEMAYKLGYSLTCRPKERIKVRSKELERLLVNVEDAELFTDRHNMMLFLQRDTSKKRPAGYEIPMLNIFDPADDQENIPCVSIKKQKAIGDELEQPKNKEAGVRGTANATTYLDQSEDDSDESIIKSDSSGIKSRSESFGSSSSSCSSPCSLSSESKECSKYNNNFSSSSSEDQDEYDDLEEEMKQGATDECEVEMCSDHSLGSLEETVREDRMTHTALLTPTQPKILDVKHAKKGRTPSNRKSIKVPIPCKSLCARPGCLGKSRFDSLFCSDSCGVCALEMDLMRSLEYARIIHPSLLRF